MDSIVIHARETLEKQLVRYRAGGSVDGVIVAAEQLLRVTSPAAVEDREYFSVDLGLPISQRCGEVSERWGRKCSRRAGHVHPNHRDAEVSW